MTRRVVTFAALAYALSWLAWLQIPRSPYWHLVGGMGPAVAALVVAASDGSLRPLLRRLAHAPPRWLAVGALAPAALFVVAAVVLRAGGADVDVSQTARTTEYAQLGVGAYVVANLVCYGLGEELGWRGHLLPLLQRRLSPLYASLVVAGIWSAWHLPLFFVAPGMSSMGAATIAGWVASMIAGSFLMTALFNRSGGSVLAVAVFHGVLDVLINSPTGPALSSVMGAGMTVAGIVAIRWLRPPSPTAVDTIDATPTRVS